MPYPVEASFVCGEVFFFDTIKLLPDLYGVGVAVGTAGGEVLVGDGTRVFVAVGAGMDVFVFVGTGTGVFVFVAAGMGVFVAVGAGAEVLV